MKCTCQVPGINHNYIEIGWQNTSYKPGLRLFKLVPVLQVSIQILITNHWHFCLHYHPHNFGSLASWAVICNFYHSYAYVIKAEASFLFVLLTELGSCSVNEKGKFWNRISRSHSLKIMSFRRQNHLLFFLPMKHTFLGFLFLHDLSRG